MGGLEAGSACSDGLGHRWRPVYERFDDGGRRVAEGHHCAQCQTVLVGADPGHTDAAMAAMDRLFPDDVTPDTSSPIGR